MAISVGSDLMQKLVDALRLHNQPIRRIVIDVSYDDVTKVYVQRLLQENEADEIAEAVAETADRCQVVETTHINIDEQGNVTTPHPWRTFTPRKLIDS